MDDGGLGGGIRGDGVGAAVLDGEAADGGGGDDAGGGGDGGAGGEERGESVGCACVGLECRGRRLRKGGWWDDTVDVLLHAEEDGLDVEIHDLVPGFLVMLLKRRAPRCSGVREEDVDVVRGLGDFTHEMFYPGYG